MAVKSLSLGSTRKYELKSDPDKGTPDATRFIIGTLDSRVVGKIMDAATSFFVDQKQLDDEIETSVNNSEKNFQACMYGLKGWENFKDEKNNDIPFKTVKRRHGGASYDAVDPEILKTIPQAFINELANEILKDNVVGEVEGNA